MIERILFELNNWCYQLALYSASELCQRRKLRMRVTQNKEI